ncbi:MarR family winged helix-turn-helix transcriptional regulator [Nocardia stercoris]|uniref:MarR family transcriptional regulator n=1 Tax=Nocardia stercoris TaxID=2483361 RepID=A0A3M2L3H5_9NOCA|nr:MarR family winged helix-turn-helix transcriptional regulator [Nocardia stercoris]RMI32269.1 MarR family transcriptional regulator [Nocardia stercoris]
MTVARSLDDLEMRTWLGYMVTRDLIATAVHRDLAVAAEWDPALRANLTVVEYAVLTQLAVAPGQRRGFTELAEVLEWSQSRLSHQITRMQRRGLVTRVAVPDDARRTAAALTPQGAELLAVAAPAHTESVRRNLIDVLDRDQLHALAEIYATLLNHHRGRPPDEPAAV